MSYFFLINGICIYVSSFVAYVCYRTNRRTVMWSNIVAAAINAIALMLGLALFFFG